MTESWGMGGENGRVSGSFILYGSEGTCSSSTVIFSFCCLFTLPTYAPLPPTSVLHGAVGLVFCNTLLRVALLSTLAPFLAPFLQVRFPGLSLSPQPQGLFFGLCNLFPEPMQPSWLTFPASMTFSINFCLKKKRRHDWLTHNPC